MAHERITGDDVAGDLIVSWTDDAGIVDIGMIWDEPKGHSDVPAAGEVQTNLPPTSTTRNDTAVHERRVEGGPGGTISVPVIGNPGDDGSCPLQAFLDNEGRWSIYMAFDRPKLNGLIRTLRRARNKAFGADE